MADDKREQRDLNLRQALPWTELFRGFQVALDPKKLLLAAGGILAMALSWWLLAVIFGLQEKPQWDDPKYDQLRTYYQQRGSGAAEAQQLSWDQFRQDRDKWNILWRAAGTGSQLEYTDAGDLAATPEEHDAIREPINREIERLREQRARTGQVTVGTTVYTLTQKPYGALRTMPWFEDRGPNPFLMVTGQIGQPWPSGQFGDWLLTQQAPVLIEPLVKFLTPVVLLLDPRSGALNRLYFLLVILATLAVWALFGGAITRMASVQLARNENVGMREALRFVWSRYISYLSAPLFPLLFIAAMVVLLNLYGFVFMIPVLGDVLIAGLGWPLVLLAGLVMAVVLVGLVGWPMMYTTISAEGSDAFDAISRSYSYVYQGPWNYVWYSLVAIGYGAVVVFFVGFMGSAIVYLGKWGVQQTPGIDWADRAPSFLFVYAPESFNWRALLLEGAKVNGRDLVVQGVVQPGPLQEYREQMHWWNTAGAFLVSIWLYAFFLMILGFGYSYFWSASTIIYLLMRRKVDDTDLDEIYLEEDDEEPYTTPAASSAKGSQGTAVTTMVETPTLRSSATPPVPKGTDERSEASAVVAAGSPPTSPTVGHDGNSPSQDNTSSS